MTNKELWQVSVNIEKQLCFCFTAEKVVCEKGVGFIEKNIAKNTEDLACIALYAPEKNIALRCGVATLVFSVESGNSDDFLGDYKISFLGRDGLVSVVHYADVK